MVHSDRLKPYYNPAHRPTNIPEAYIRQPPEPIELEEDEPEQNAQTQGAQNRVQETDQGQDIHKEKPKTTVPADDPKDWEPEKIIKGSNYRGRLVYKVKFKDRNNGSSKTEWVYADNLPLEMRKDFHIKYTFSGKCRKKVKPRPSA